MKAKYILVVAAICLFIFGLGMLLLPFWTMDLFNIPIADGGVLIVQLLGAAFLGLAAMNYAARNIAVLADARAVFLANFVMNTLGFFIALWYKLDGVGNAWAWIPVVLYLIFALGFGYCLLDRHSIEEAKVSARHA